MSFLYGEMEGKEAEQMKEFVDELVILVGRRRGS